MGAYGGTFDPIHNGHIAVARAVRENFELEQLLIIPSARPPHKKRRSISEAYQRYAMAVLGTLDLPGVAVSSIELESPGQPYTFQTVERLRECYGEESKLFFVMGSDSFVDLEFWKEPQRILANCGVVIASRPGFRLDRTEADRLAAALGNAERPGSVKLVDLRETHASVAEATSGETRGAVYLTDYGRVDASATEIRRQVQMGRGVGDLVPAAVDAYIRKYHLYSET
ncbi:MAG TPA: nicotinate-nucleotide adenylyltransferase [Blastocatellia bacterium]|nr:nicotinate-nucleotide adenylyltransferase [Blastocatellia bacterium]